jgi:hypothetical protein
MPLQGCVEQSKVIYLLACECGRRSCFGATENNLFLVKRLIQRTDMRNPDTAPQRYTSLAWTAVLGHDETFEFLLGAGHDDDELSRVWLSNSNLSFSLL